MKLGEEHKGGRLKYTAMSKVNWRIKGEGTEVTSNN